MIQAMNFCHHFLHITTATKSSGGHTRRTAQINSSLNTFQPTLPEAALEDDLQQDVTD